MEGSCELLRCRTDESEKRMELCGYTSLNLFCPFKSFFAFQTSSCQNLHKRGERRCFISDYYSGSFEATSSVTRHFSLRKASVRPMLESGQNDKHKAENEQTFHLMVATNRASKRRSDGSITQGIDISMIISTSLEMYWNLSCNQSSLPLKPSELRKLGLSLSLLMSF
jgi:hypothetical protein